MRNFEKLFFSISRDELDSGMRLLMECAFRPVITPETVADGLNNIENDLMYLKQNILPINLHFNFME